MRRKVKEKMLFIDELSSQLNVLTSQGLYKKERIMAVALLSAIVGVFHVHAQRCIFAIKHKIVLNMWDLSLF